MPRPHKTSPRQYRMVYEDNPQLKKIMPNHLTKALEDARKEFEKGIKIQNNSGNPYFPNWEGVLQMFSSSHLAILEAMEKEISTKIPTRNTKVNVEGGKDITKTTRKSLLLMGYLQAFTDILTLIKEAKEVI